MARSYIYERRKDSYAEYYRTKANCDRMFLWKKADVNSCSFSKRTFVNLVNSSKFDYNSADAKKGRDDEYCVPGETGTMPSECTCESLGKSFLSPLRSQSIHAPSSEPKISMLNSANDARSPQNIAKAHSAMQCKINSFSKLIRPKLYFDDYSEQVRSFTVDFHTISVNR